MQFSAEYGSQVLIRQTEERLLRELERKRVIAERLEEQRETGHRSLFSRFVGATERQASARRPVVNGARPAHR